MKLRVRCTSRSEDTNNKTGNGVWTYTFYVVAETGVVPEQRVEFKLASDTMLHYKRNHDYALHLDDWSGIDIIPDGKIPRLNQ